MNPTRPTNLPVSSLIFGILPFSFLLVAPAALAQAAAQAAAPGVHGTVSAGRVANLVARGTELLEREDPIGAIEVFRSLRAIDPDHAAGLVGLGQTHLLLGEPWIALRYAEAAFLPQ